jgi:hypothetical protein
MVFTILLANNGYFSFQLPISFSRQLTLPFCWNGDFDILALPFLFWASKATGDTYQPSFFPPFNLFPSSTFSLLQPFPFFNLFPSSTFSLLQPFPFSSLHCT